MKQLALTLSVLALAAAPMAANAAPCRDAHGHFVTCPKAAPARPAAPKRCRVGGRFASCSAPGAKPA